MNNWRTVFAWQVGPDWPQVGDEVRVIATNYQLNVYYGIEAIISGDIGRVTRMFPFDRNKLTPEEEAETIAVKFPNRPERFYFPTEYWKQALEIV